MNIGISVQRNTVHPILRVLRRLSKSLTLIREICDRLSLVLGAILNLDCFCSEQVLVSCQRISDFPQLYISMCKVATIAKCTRTSALMMPTEFGLVLLVDLVDFGLREV